MVCKANEGYELIEPIVLGAGHSIDLIAESSMLFSNLNLIDVLALADERLNLRAILHGSAIEHLKQQFHKHGAFGWDIKIIESKPQLTCLVLDNSTVLVNAPFINKETTFKADNPEIVKATVNHFNNLWSKGVELVYENLLLERSVEERNRIVQISDTEWIKVIEYLKNNPQELYYLPPRKFEELVAELIRAQDYDVMITQTTKDGGRDILAQKNTTLGRLLYLVECKRYSKNRPIGVGLVRALYGIVEKERATAGILVTTSRFTKGASDFRDEVKNRMDFVNYVRLQEWLQSY
jgi:HJR/Mrr/RecB family endonuclease